MRKRDDSRLSEQRREPDRFWEKTGLAVLAGILIVGFLAIMPERTPEDRARIEARERAEARREAEARKLKLRLEMAEARAESRKEAARDQIMRTHADTIRSLPDVKGVRWQKPHFYIFVDFRGTVDQFDLLALQVCRSLRNAGAPPFIAVIADARYATLGETKQLGKRWCR